MKLLQNNVLRGNKLNCFKDTQMLGSPTPARTLEDSSKDLSNFEDLLFVSRQPRVCF